MARLVAIHLRPAAFFPASRAGFNSLINMTKYFRAAALLALAAGLKRYPAEVFAKGWWAFDLL
jgi:hypothetical protein